MIEYLAATAIVSGGVMFIAGRLTSGVKGWRADLDNLQRHYDASVERIDRLGRICRIQGRTIAEYVAADYARQAQRKEAARISGEKRHAARLAREAEASARYVKTHAELVGLVGDASRPGLGAPEGAEPHSRLGLAPPSLSQGEAA